MIDKDTTWLTSWLIVLSIRISGWGLIFWSGKQFLDTKIESTKQSDDPESTRVLTDAGKEGDESMTCNAFKTVSNAEPRFSADSLVGFRQSTPQGMR